MNAYVIFQFHRGDVPGASAGLVCDLIHDLGVSSHTVEGESFVTIKVTGEPAEVAKVVARWHDLGESIPMPACVGGCEVGEALITLASEMSFQAA